MLEIDNDIDNSRTKFEFSTLFRFGFTIKRMGAVWYYCYW